MHRLGLKRFISSSALAGLCADLGVEGTSRFTIKRKRHADLTETTPYGNILVERAIAGTKIWMVHPIAFLWRAANSCQEFSRFLRVAGAQSVHSF